MHGVSASLGAGCDVRCMLLVAALRKAMNTSLDLDSSWKFSQSIYRVSENRKRMKNSKAQEKVFSTLELWEAILLQLPLQELLVNAQLVNRSWNADIKSSPSLQQYLFFQAWLEADNRSDEINPLLRAKFPPFFGDGWLPWAKDKKARKAFWRVNSHTRGKVRFEDGVQMGALYDIAEVRFSVPITGFSMAWPAADMKPGVDKTVVMNIYQVAQCCVDSDGSDNEESLRSEGAEQYDIKFEQNCRIDAGLGKE
ncbi:hypothetical protein G7Y89_g8358 [Cudoniella acicularis]|uniref:F-box domain-containing protein n=1 Tax=Cudoniella acicularis TaxID=354080 RepID=A0A8H4W156_9HELO|nr:hypothetical protein G7Y89_g8358 [Cudoniella acicularis]